MPVPLPMDAAAVLNREFLEIRAKILELAASFDRLDRAGPTAGGAADPRLGLIRQGLEILLAGQADRAEQVQLLFSREYDDDWRAQMEIPPRTGKS